MNKRQPINDIIVEINDLHAAESLMTTIYEASRLVDHKDVGLIDQYHRAVAMVRKYKRRVREAREKWARPDRAPRL